MEEKDLQGNGVRLDISDVGCGMSDVECGIWDVNSGAKNSYSHFICFPFPFYYFGRMLIINPKVNTSRKTLYNDLFFGPIEFSCVYNDDEVIK